jgi:hypothetical protein
VGGVGGGALNDNGDRREYKIILILLITILIKNINSTPPSSFPKSNKINMADKDYRPSSSVGIATAMSTKRSLLILIVRAASLQLSHSLLALALTPEWLIVVLPAPLLSLSLSLSLSRRLSLSGSPLALTLSNIWLIVALFIIPLSLLSHFSLPF